MGHRRTLAWGSVGLLALILLGTMTVRAQQQPIPPLPAEILRDPAKIEIGKEVWGDQCRHCHGYDAYPGKAPKLEPGRYSPEFVYHRVTYGFKDMPAWQDIYGEEQRIGLVAYILSGSFAP